MRTVLRYLAGTALVLLLVGAGTAWRTEQVAGRDERDPADALLVLGAAQYDGRPSPVFQARLDHAAELYGQGTAPLVMTVGGNQEGDATTEGAAGRAYLIERGLPEDAVVAVPTGRDTLASLRAAADALTADGVRSVVLVTDPMHAARAATMAADLGLVPQVSPVQDGPAVRDGLGASYLLRETLGTVFYRVTGGSSGLGTPVT